MQKINIISIIQELNQKLLTSFNDFEGVYFYGSRLKDNSVNDSDIDLAAIFKYVDRKKRMSIWRIVGEIEYKYNVILDLHPMIFEDLKQNPYYYEQVVTNGQFYEAA